MVSNQAIEKAKSYVQERIDDYIKDRERMPFGSQRPCEDIIQEWFIEALEDDGFRGAEILDAWDRQINPSLDFEI